MSNINPQSIEMVKEVISEILTRIGVEGSITASLGEYRERETISLNIGTENDANLLIGPAGEHLIALQHLARILFRKKYDIDVPFVIDVNNYKKDKEEKLKSLARSIALKVRRTREQEILKPMASYDRWVIHNFLASEEDLATESHGVDPERKVIVKLVK